MQVFEETLLATVSRILHGLEGLKQLRLASLLWFFQRHTEVQKKIEPPNHALGKSSWKFLKAHWSSEEDWTFKSLPSSSKLTPDQLWLHNHLWKSGDSWQTRRFRRVHFFLWNCRVLIFRDGVLFYHHACCGDGLSQTNAFHVPAVEISC